MSRILAVAAIIAVLTACGEPAAPEMPPAHAAAAAFYSDVLSMNSGVPSAEELAALRPVLSSSLEAALLAARAAEDAHTLRVNNEEPPYLQGSLFTSLFEGATAFSVSGECDGDEKGRACRIDLTYADDRGETKWSDLLVLVPEDGAWKVEDIEYQGDWDFANKGRLSDALKAVVAEEAAAAASGN